MALSLEVPYSSTFSTSKPLSAVYAYIANYEKCLAECFPGLLRLERRAGGIQVWNFEKIHYGSYSLEIRVITRVEEKPDSRIDMQPVKESGYSTLSGNWSFMRNGTMTQASLSLSLLTELPIPGFLKSMAVPLAQKELGKLFDRYLANVAKAVA